MYAIFWLMGIWLTTTSAATAMLNLDLTQGQEGAIPISLKRPSKNNELARKVADILTKDLRYTSRLELVSTTTQADYRLEMQAKAQQLCLNMYTAALSSTQSQAICVPTAEHSAASIAHFFAQSAYTHILGKQAIYNSKLAYVKEQQKAQKSTYDLMLADFDGGQAEVLLTSDEPIMSPTFSPNGKRLAYVSFEGGTQKIFIQEIATGKRQLIASKPGLNAAPAWSPDGKKLAIVQSPQGRAKIMLYDIKSQILTPMLDEAYIQTEPVWRSDAKHIIFTSDRNGTAQIYDYNLDTKVIERLTKHGSYNVSPSISQDGKYLIYLTRLGSKLQTVALNLKEQELQWIGSGKLDDTPKITQGDMVVYAHRQHGKSTLSIVAIDGSFSLPIAQAEANIKYPAWHR